MSGIRFTDDFKHDAVTHVVDRGYSVAAVSERMRFSTKSLYTWKAQFSMPREQITEATEQAAGIRRLKKELARVSEERDILKKATVAPTGSLDLSRFDAAPLIAFTATKETDYALPGRVMQSMIPRGD
ncbi:MAG: transposase [Sulfitobacter sp.]